jgi:glycosyltransferase involved in cell wall biosynthesis
MSKQIKKIGIDCRSISIGGGVKTYLVNLFNEIGKIDEINEYFIYYDSEINLGTFKFNNFREIVVKNKYKFLIPYWEQIKLRNRIIKDKIEIFHGPKNTISLFLPKNVKKIVTVHDLTPFLFKHEMSYFDSSYWNFFIPLSVKLSDKVIAISEATKNDLIKFFPRSKDKINIIYHGSEQNKIINEGMRSQFFLVVGAIRPRKNIERVLLALSKLSDHNIKIYLIGKNLNYLKKIKSLINKLNIEERVVIRGYVSKNELNLLYSKAIGYLYPSLYEGFGFPILEAQSFCLPVITSNISSMPEIAGRGALLVNPYSEDEIRIAMEKLITDQLLRKTLIKLGLENIKRFSWNKCAHETLKIYEEL